jgi:hypothetical protein
MAKREFVLDDNGKRLQVIRPSNPARALELAREAIGSDGEKFQGVLGQVEKEGGRYTYRGLLGRCLRTKRLVVVDPELRFREETLPGDSFVTGIGPDNVIRPGIN